MKKCNFSWYFACLVEVATSQTREEEGHSNLAATVSIATIVFKYPKNRSQKKSAPHLFRDLSLEFPFTAGKVFFGGLLKLIYRSSGHFDFL